MRALGELGDLFQDYWFSTKEQRGLLREMACHVLDTSKYSIKSCNATRSYDAVETVDEECMHLG